MPGTLDFDRIKALILRELEPHRLVERIAEDRAAEARVTGPPAPPPDEPTLL